MTQMSMNCKIIFLDVIYTTMKYQDVGEEKIAITIPSSMDEYHKEIISDPNKCILYDFICLKF